ncbi:hypothetical protein [Mariniflexile sp.]|uniref:hypothetical protein n=1 Tax=Mariniflexile sp. TaxID=1979402 RepID=UPI0035655F13
MEIKQDNSFGCIQFKKENDNRIYLEASYDKENFQMMLDSYSWFSALPYEWTVNKWKFKKTPYIYTTRDINNKRQKVKLRLMDKIKISNTFSASNFYINPKKTLDKYNLGVLGNDFLDELNWKIDFTNRNLCFDNKYFNVSNLEVKNKFKKTDFPWLTIKIGEIEHKVIIDLGASQEIIIPLDSKLGTWLISTYNLSSKLVKTGGANSEKLIDELYEIELDSILIEEALIRNVHIQIRKNTKVSLIGCEFLKRGVLYLNYKTPDEDFNEIGFEFYKK